MNLFIQAFPSVDRLFSELKNSEIDGVFMDKYRAAYHLNKEPIDSGFKVFQSFSVKIKYYFAIKSPMDRYLRQLMECFRNKLMKNNDLDDLLMEYLKPVLVSEKSNTVKPPLSGHPWDQAKLSAYKRLKDTNTIGGRV